MRPPIILGPGDQSSLDLYKLPKKGFKLVVGRKPRYYSIVSVSDMCRGVGLMVDNDSSNGEIFYFTTGDPIEWGDLQDVIATEAFNREKRLRNLAMPPRLAIALGGMLSFFGKLRGRKSSFVFEKKEYGFGVEI